MIARNRVRILKKNMGEEKPKALVGFHTEQGRSDFARYFGRAGYEIIAVDNVEGMLGAMGLETTSVPDAKPNVDIRAYVMDTNLGLPGADDFSSASRIYEHIKREVSAGNVKFGSFTGNLDLVERASSAEIPCRNKSEAFDWFAGNFLK